MYLIRERSTAALLAVLAALTLATFSRPFGSTALADDQPHHPAHPPHNMVLLGLDEVFASHIVYKTPHNFQVELAVKLPPDVQAVYRAARVEHPDDTYIFLLDSMSIADIGTQERLSGQVFRLDAEDRRTDLASDVVLERDAFRVVFFQKLPLSLARP